MSSDNVVSLHPGTANGRDYESWEAWAECETAVLGRAFEKINYDWREAFERGLRPEAAAREAVFGANVLD